MYRPLARFGALAVATACLVGFSGEPALSSEAIYIRSTEACPTDPEVLVNQLLADLPSYANRVASRQLDLSHQPLGPVTSVLVASPPDLTPIALATLTPDASTPPTAPHETLQQVFFTTLERQYRPAQTVDLQQHHWLFLADAEDGWYLAMLYSSLAPAPDAIAPRPPTPPRESSEGIVGQAVRLWLRDCRAGAVFPTSEGEAIAPRDDSSRP
ncbi:hypothetical protein IQ254_15650 [Nodosilinea sp. LEGE 07088]|uniref:hypothetical protein n=1 Tax=Nodosilinea sp. LEGE 07088 TaxID=2777968 RepID=UPI00188248DE|nr:hypothetical protein [Nodosilinea sp. LEGE 07088]MBE9138608.1 hypothetical protein [Nodosilinea sp. LEGE 07088]